MATIRDIAARSGTSIGTVDRILHNRGRFSAETAERVFRVVQELQYRPNVIARQLSQSRTVRLGVILPSPDQDSGYWSLLLAGVRKAESELAPFNCRLVYFHFNRYRDGAISSLEKEVALAALDAVVMAPLRADESVHLMNALGVPVIFVDTDISDSRRRSYIGQDSYQSGRLGARLMKMVCRELGQPTSSGLAHFLVVRPDADNEHLDNRVRGFAEGLGAGFQIVRVGIEGDHDLRAFRATLGNHLMTGPSGIFVADASSHFTAEYLASQSARETFGVAGRPALIGYDLVPGNRHWLEQGVIDALLTQRPADQGYRAIRALFRFVYLDEPCVPKMHTPIEIVLRENLHSVTGDDVL